MVLSEALRSGTPRRSLRAERYKYIGPVNGDGKGAELYDLVEDPGERGNLAREMAEMTERYARLAEAYASAHTSGSEAIIDEGLREQLRALGYIQ